MLGGGGGLFVLDEPRTREASRRQIGLGEGLL
jgi:hypothetical protein